ncbi:MAG: hypothetical protein LBB18_00335 [Puniceicoccales bacterium]|nr:hypothetical protein [Puniceicoccales bacterium]
MKTEGLLEKLQDAVEKRLLSVSELRNIPILASKGSDLPSIIETNSKIAIGSAIVLMPPIPSGADEHAIGPIFGGVVVEVKIFENTMVNRTGKSLLFLAETVMENLHGWYPGVGDENYQLTLASGPNACRGGRENDTTFFSIRFVIPYNL